MRYRYIKDSVSLRSENGDIKNFHITKRIDKGGSVVCYEAYHDNSMTGILKEFYPYGTKPLKRKKDGSLVCPTGVNEYGISSFEAARENYLEPYRRLLKNRTKEEYKVLNTFIPHFEIYYGSGDKRKSTAYIWSASPELETFESFCKDIHKHPNVRPEHKLVKAICAIRSLCQCVCQMHMLDIIHCDIKPSNFGFIKRGEILTETISFFDIDSFRDIFDNINETKYTDGYIEPEAFEENYSLNSKRDIFSIGAALFYAIIITDEVKNNQYIYDFSYYDRLKEMVNSSKLIQASESNSHPKLRNILYKILKNCLCKRENRYFQCEQLLNDINEALYYALPMELDINTYSNMKWKLSDIEKSLDKNTDKNSKLAIQYHLYGHPLYKYACNNEINCLVLGFGSYGQKFLDISMEVSQIPNYSLKATVVSGDESDREEYLFDRPQLKDFFDIDSPKSSSDSYGSIYFRTEKLSYDHKNNTEIIKSLIKSDNDSRFNYVFIALGDKKLNYNTAQQCKEIADSLNIKLTIAFACEDEEYIGPEDIIPIYVNKPVDKQLYSEIERMAFNAHLIWNDNLNVSFNKVWKDFKKTYNYNSCVSNILSIKYKLYSLNIDLDDLNLSKAAEKFKNIALKDETSPLRIELIYTEHKRWVTEKLCDGWRSIDDPKDCLKLGTKNERKKLHVCIRKSRADLMLKKGFETEQWDKITQSEMNKLDELDRMSVELHKVYDKEAKRIIKKDNLLNGSVISSIREILRKSKSGLNAFNEWFACLNDICSGEYKREKQYEGLMAAVADAAKDLSIRELTGLKKQLEIFDTLFKPILAGAKYTDYKDIDSKLIDNIPFILTYTKDITLVVPYTMGSCSEVFNNLASATVINPKKIIYIVELTDIKMAAEFKLSIPGVIKYMKKKQFRASVEFIIAYGNKIENHIDSLKKEIIALSEKRVRSISFLKYSINASRELTEKITEILNKKEKTNIIAEIKNSNISGILSAGDFYKTFKSFSFDLNTKSFENNENCPMLNYIPNKTHITISDMLSFRMSSGKSLQQPEFYNDYKELWDKYSENKGIWKSLCVSLEEYSNKNDNIVELNKNITRARADQYIYILPSECYFSLEKIISELKRYGIAEVNSSVNIYTSDSCRVIIFDKHNDKKSYDKLFSNSYKLILTDMIYTVYTDNCLKIYYNDLTVNNVQPESYQAVKLLEYFSQKSYILDLRKMPNNAVSFSYATKQIKHMLSNAGSFLEIYTYHKLKETGGFDDVVSSFEIYWNNEDNIKNEIDCLAITGFNTLIIECKARKYLNADFYYKLTYMLESFGTNAKAVLIADTQEEKRKSENIINKQQRERGNFGNIITVWKEEEIKNIGKTLLSIANNRD